MPLNKSTSSGVVTLKFFSDPLQKNIGLFSSTNSVQTATESRMFLLSASLKRVLRYPSFIPCGVCVLINKSRFSKTGCPPPLRQHFR